MVEVFKNSKAIHCFFRLLFKICAKSACDLTLLVFTEPNAKIDVVSWTSKGSEHCCSYQAIHTLYISNPKDMFMSFKITNCKSERDLNCRSSFPPQNLFCQNWLAGWCHGCTYALNWISRLCSQGQLCQCSSGRGNSVFEELPVKQWEPGLHLQDYLLPGRLSWGCLLECYTERSSRKQMLQQLSWQKSCYTSASSSVKCTVPFAKRFLHCSLCDLWFTEGILRWLPHSHPTSSD